MSLIHPAPESMSTPVSDITDAPELPVAEAMPDPRVQRLGEIRGRIDKIDRQIVALWNERAGLGLEADAVKDELRQPVLNALREQEVIENVVNANEGPMDSAFFAGMFMSGMRQIRDRQRAARERRAANDDQSQPGSFN